MKNVPFFKAEDLPPRARYEKLFENLPPLPDLRFSQFLRTLSPADLQAVRLTLVRCLIQDGVIPGKHLALDSCSIKANVKETNFKASAPNRFDKTRLLPGDPDARLGVLIHYPQAVQTKIAWFWGYRNHILKRSCPIFLSR